MSDAGSASVSGTNTINITGVGSSLTIGHTYNLITAASGLTGTFQFTGGSNTETIAVGGHAYTLTLANSGTAETVTVSAETVVYWVGTASVNWDDTTMNWSTASGGTADVLYSDGDTAIFDNGTTGTDFNVTVTAAVAPASVIFENTSAHAFARR